MRTTRRMKKIKKKYIGYMLGLMGIIVIAGGILAAYDIVLAGKFAGGASLTLIGLIVAVNRISKFLDACEGLVDRFIRLFGADDDSTSPPPTT